MASDIVLHNDHVEVSEGDLRVTRGGLSVKGGDVRVNGAAVIATTLGTGQSQMSGSQVRVGRRGGVGTVTVHARAAAGGTSIIGGRTQTINLQVGRPKPVESNVGGANGTLRIFNQNVARATITLSATGTVTANIVNANRLVERSDARCKTDVRPLEGSALDRVMALRAVAFRWREDHATPSEIDGGGATPDEIGFVAQEVEDVVPEVVTHDEDGLLSMSYTSLVPVLTEALKEQQQMIEELQQRLARLET